MGHPIDFDGANATLYGGQENVADMRVFRNGLCCVSCWALSPAEVAEVARTGKVFISVFSGATQPPIFAGGEEQTRGLIADYGVWKRDGG